MGSQVAVLSDKEMNCLLWFNSVGGVARLSANRCGVLVDGIPTPYKWSVWLTLFAKGQLKGDVRKPAIRISPDGYNTLREEYGLEKTR